MKQFSELVATVLLLVLANVAMAEVRTASTPAELNSAISAAAHGDEIRLLAGTWNITAQIVTSKALTFSGGWNSDFETRAGGAVTIFDGADASNLLSLSVPTAKECVVDRVTFTHSLSSALVKSGDGALAVSNCAFLVNALTQYAQGRAMKLTGKGTVMVRNCRFEGNIATVDGQSERQGGAVYASSIGGLVVEDSTFLTNGLSMAITTNNGPANQGLGGSALCIHGTPSQIRRCVFRGNVSRGHNSAECGGAILLYNNCNGSVVEDCLFVGNQCIRSPWGEDGSGAIYVYADNVVRTVSIRGCTFAYNLGTPATMASGLYVRVGKATVLDSIFYGNMVPVATATVATDLSTGVNGVIDISHSMISANASTSYSGTVSVGSGMLYGDPLFATDAATASSYVDATTKKFDVAKLADILAMDVHVKSAAGRWTSGGWVADAVNSLTLDWSADDAAWANEPTPNGNRRNLGYYGNNAEASKSEPATPQLVSTSVTYPTPYTKPTVTVTAGVSDGTYYNGTITIYYATGTVATVGYAYTNIVGKVGVGDVKAIVAPDYFDPGQEITIRVELSVRGKTTAYKEIKHTVDSTKIRPPWIGHGGDPEKVIHVREGADSAQNGSNWTDAYPDIASALAALTATKNEIWVSGKIDCPSPLIPLVPTFDVVIRGGFTGVEDEVADRSADPKVRATIDFKDVGGPLKLAVPSGRTVRIDRMNIVHAYENGIYKSDSGNLYVSDSAIEANGLIAPNAQGRGANLTGSGSTVTFTNCIFGGNAVYQSVGHNSTLNGGAIYAYGIGLLRLIDTDFYTNGVAVTSTRPGPIHCGHGGAAVYANNTKVVASGCTFRGNVGISRNMDGSTGTVRLINSGCDGSSFTNCLFVGNNNLRGSYSNEHGGALSVASSSGSEYTVDVVNCTIAYNLDNSPAGVGGLFVANATVNLVSSIVYGNQAYVGTTGASDMQAIGTGSIRSSYSLITANSLSSMRGQIVDVAGTLYGDPLFVTTPADFNACVLTEYNDRRFVTATAADIAALCNFDVHLKAKLGYWTNDGTYVGSCDTNSPALDTGDPAADYSRELSPNGERVNAGCYGNTAEASHSRRDKPEIDSVTITYPDGYPQPNVAVTMGGAAGAEYSETVYILYGTGDVAQCGFAFTNMFSGVKYGDVVHGVAPYYFGLGEQIAVSVITAPNSAEPVVYGTVEEIPDDLEYPIWHGKGGGSNVIHVRAGANCLKTGANWTDAFPDMTAAINALNSEKTEIWVAGHIVYPSAPAQLSPPVPLKIMGGFTGSENSADERVSGARSTLDGNALYDPLNIYNAETCGVRLERLVLTRGETRGLTKNGVGELVMDDCLVSANGRNAMVGGRGIRLSRPDWTTPPLITITNCVFAGNVAETGPASLTGGGAIYAENIGRLLVVDTQFVTNGIEFARFNQAQPWWGYAGAAIYSSGTPVTLVRCAFRANAGRPHNSLQNAGTVALLGNCHGSVISNCLFVGNMDAKPGWVEKNGAALNVVMTDATQTVDVVNCTVAFNETDSCGTGGICVNRGCMNLVNSIVYGNRHAAEYSAPCDLEVGADGTLNASYCLFTSNALTHIRCAGTTNFTNIIYGDPRFVTTDAEVLSQLADSAQRYRLDNECAAAVCGFNVHVRGMGYVDEITGQLTPAYPSSDYSPAIDSGDPASKAWKSERKPTGRRTNLGAYGGTPYSSCLVNGFVIIVR